MIDRIRKLPAGRTVAAILVAAWLLSGVYTVARDEEGVVLLLGRAWREHAQPGIHYAPPWPIGERKVVRTTSAYQMSIGFKIADAVQGRLPDPEETEFLTGDTNILAVEMILQYVIDQPFGFAYRIEDPHFLVRRAAEATATSFLARTTVDDALTTGRASLLEAVRHGTQEKLRSYGAGIAIVSATLKRIEPAGDVIEAFQDVQNAKADRERSINEATGYANEVLPRARGESEAKVASAQAEKNRRVEIARGEADGLRKMIAEYHAAPEGTRERLFLEVVEDVLARAKVYVIDGGPGRSPMGLKLIE